MKRRNNKIYALSLISLMIAIMFIFGFTPLGTISFGALNITLMGIPIAIIACLFGPIMGAIMGAVWGTISLIQAFTLMDPTAILLNNYVPEYISQARWIIGMIVTCFITRTIVGFLSGVFFDLMKKVDKKGYVSSLIGSMTVPLLNTILFMTSFCLFFYNTKAIQENFSQYTNPFTFVIGIVGINFIIEFLVNAILGSAISFSIMKASEKMGLASPFKHFFTKKEKIEKNIEQENITL